MPDSDCDPDSLDDLDRRHTALLLYCQQHRAVTDSLETRVALLEVRCSIIDILADTCRALTDTVEQLSTPGIEGAQWNVRQHVHAIRARLGRSGIQTSPAAGDSGGGLSQGVAS